MKNDAAHVRAHVTTDTHTHGPERPRSTSRLCHLLGQQPRALHHLRQARLLEARVGARHVLAVQLLDVVRAARSGAAHGTTHKPRCVSIACRSLLLPLPRAHLAYNARTSSSETLNGGPPASESGGPAARCSVCSRMTPPGASAFVMVSTYFTRVGGSSATSEARSHTRVNCGAGGSLKKSPQYSDRLPPEVTRYTPTLFALLTTQRTTQ
jgi:hypothetical protein